jgi:hypothetical protein
MPSDPETKAAAAHHHV